MKDNWPEQMRKDWELLKMEGNELYRTGEGVVEPIDLYYAGGILQPFVVGCIIKYAFRNRNKRPDLKDARKIRHYTDILIFIEKWGPTPPGATLPRSQDALQPQS